MERERGAEEGMRRKAAFDQGLEGQEGSQKQTR